MRVTLAGYNLDAEAIDLLRQSIEEHKRGGDLAELMDRLADEPLTPETLSAAYARISRSEKGVRELRRDARSSVSRARQSNERIVFGLGHASVAEHAVFNIDITDASRLAIEYLELHRLASFTESSQRYIPMSGDYALPQEIAGTTLAEEYKALCDRLFEGYRLLSEQLESFHSDLPEKERAGRAREDARYLLPLSCRGQVGMTVNSRSAEYIIQQASQAPLAEVREMGRQLHSSLRFLVPSLIKYIDPNPEWAASEAEILSSSPAFPAKVDGSSAVKLLAGPEEAEATIVATLLMRVSSVSFKEALSAAKAMGFDRIRRLILASHRHINEHFPVRRELELATFRFEVILSASAFAQMKRHRIATIIPFEYDPGLDVTIPSAIVEAGLEESFRRYTQSSVDLFEALCRVLQQAERPAARYALTNSHRRRIIFQANARELIHLSRLREDRHAQWDIRNLAGEILSLAASAAPGLMLLAGGKDQFSKVKEVIEDSLR